MIEDDNDEELCNDQNTHISENALQKRITLHNDPHIRPRIAPPSHNDSLCFEIYDFNKNKTLF